MTNEERENFEKTIRNGIRAAWPEQERRRYALLQAAALICTQPYREYEIGESVSRAQWLLAEIEKREKAETES